MPNNPQSGGISRRIEGDEREEMKDILGQLSCPNNYSVILRTAGLGKSLELLQWDLDILINQWNAIQEAFATKTAPALIYQDSDIVIRSIRDNLRKNIEEIIIDNPDVYTKTKNYVQQILPDFVKNLRLYQDNVPLFTRFNIEKQIETAHQREIILPSKGSIVIDKTEALIAIDINSARSTKGGNIEETALHTNLEAATEIARQLRIRDFGGLIVIDFIDMGSIRNQKSVENHLKEALKSDRARIQIGKISKFGLLEMSRQRLRPSLFEHNQISCPRCNGTGSIRSVESLSLTMLRLLEEQALNANTVRVEAQLPIEIATFILNEKRNSLLEIEKRLQVEMVIIPNKYLKSPNYKIDTISGDKLENSVKKNVSDNKISYKIVETPELELPRRIVSEKYDFEPTIKNVIPTSAKRQFGFLRKIMKFFTGKKPRLNKNTYKPKSTTKARYNNNNRYKKR
jgi:ribonuclease E